MKDVLLVFARYPEPGKCKTRLIPQLGAAGAHRLHIAMVAHTLAWAREIAHSTAIQVDVQFDGGEMRLMREQFGEDLCYTPQSSGSLGEKLQAAFESHARSSARRIVVVGTDCPQLNSKFVMDAFTRLADHEACLAPAVDGGYVLLGLGAEQPDAARPTIRREVIRNVFRDVDWGGATVLAQTVDRLCEAQVSCALLPTLADVDTPDDLEVWEQALTSQAIAIPQISVIIPTYNDEPALGQAIDSAKVDHRVEIIVVAAGDCWQSLRIASERQVKFLVSPPGRAIQLNKAVQNASADAVLFLHADTRLPANFASWVLDTLGQIGVVAGAFELKIDSPSRLARFVELGVHLRSKWRQLPYGDQALFLKRERFEQLSGFKRWPIMEDYELVLRARRQGRINTVQASVTTSPRRWESQGYIRNTLINQLMIVGYHLGISLETLANFYRRGKKDATRTESRDAS